VSGRVLRVLLCAGGVDLVEGAVSGSCVSRAVGNGVEGSVAGLDVQRGCVGGVPLRGLRCDGLLVASCLTGSLSVVFQSLESQPLTVSGLAACVLAGELGGCAGDGTVMG
jgi:hypothetical protein